MMEPNGEGNQQSAYHDANLRVFRESSATSEVKGIQQYADN